MRNAQFKAILNAAVAVKDGAGSSGDGMPMLVTDFQHLVLALDTTGNTTATVKIQGSIADTKPDFCAAASPTNQWAYVQMIDLLDQAVINGSSGVALTGTDMDRQFEVNINGLTWLNAIVTAYTQGSINVTAKVISED